MVYEWDPTRAKRAQHIKMISATAVALSIAIVPIALLTVLSGAL